MDSFKKRMEKRKLPLSEDYIPKDDWSQNEHKRRQVVGELKRSLTSTLSFEVYKKTKQEKIDLSNVKSAHRRMLTKHGFNPKKVMNLPLLYN